MSLFKLPPFLQSILRGSRGSSPSVSSVISKKTLLKVCPNGSVRRAFFKAFRSRYHKEQLDTFEVRAQEQRRLSRLQKSREALLDEPDVCHDSKKRRFSDASLEAPLPAAGQRTSVSSHDPAQYQPTTEQHQAQETEVRMAWDDGVAIGSGAQLCGVATPAPPVAFSHPYQPPHAHNYYCAAIYDGDVQMEAEEDIEITMGTPTLTSAATSLYGDSPECSAELLTPPPQAMDMAYVASSDWAASAVHVDRFDEIYSAANVPIPIPHYKPADEPEDCAMGHEGDSDRNTANNAPSKSVDLGLELLAFQVAEAKRFKAAEDARRLAAELEQAQQQKLQEKVHGAPMTSSHDDNGVTPVEQEAELEADVSSTTQDPAVGDDVLNILNEIANEVSGLRRRPAAEELIWGSGAEELVDPLSLASLADALPDVSAPSITKNGSPQTTRIPGTSKDSAPGLANAATSTSSFLAAFDFAAADLPSYEDLFEQLVEIPNADAPKDAEVVGGVSSRAPSNNDDLSCLLAGFSIS